MVLIVLCSHLAKYVKILKRHSVKLFEYTLEEFHNVPVIWFDTTSVKAHAQKYTNIPMFRAPRFRFHFYREKLSFSGAFIVFLLFALKIYCGYSLELPRKVPTITKTLCFQRIENSLGV